MRRDIWPRAHDSRLRRRKKFEETLALVDSTSPYALTGSIIASDRDAVVLATNKLRNAAVILCVIKPTGAVVGQQPFMALPSGTNDKAGSMLNLYRWLSARTIKRNFNPPTDYKYPFLQENRIRNPHYGDFYLLWSFNRSSFLTGRLRTWHRACCVALLYAAFFGRQTGDIFF